MIILKEEFNFDIDFMAPSKDAMEKFMVANETEFDESYIVAIGDRGHQKFYRITTEGWFPDCLESRDMGETNKINISKHYLSIMQQEHGFRADIHGYIPEYPGTEYGITYIGQEI